jgi:hypothetical protein
MKDAETKERFIELRAQEFSYEKIAELLEVSKRTLINWGAELSYEVENAKALRLEVLREKFILSAESKIELWGELVDRLSQELSTRDLSTVDTNKLLDMLIKTHSQLEGAFITPKVRTEDAIEYEKKNAENIDSVLRSLVDLG